MVEKKTGVLSPSATVAGLFLSIFLTGCGASSSSISDDSASTQPQPQPEAQAGLKEHAEYPVLQLAHGVASPEFIGKDFDSLFDAVNGLFVDNFPDYGPCLEDKCQSAEIDFSRSSTCAGEMPGSAYEYFMLDFSTRLEFHHCELPGSGKVLNGEIHYVYLDEDGYEIKIEFVDFSSSQAGATVAANGAITGIDPIDTSGEHAFGKRIERLEITQNGETLVISNGVIDLAVGAGGNYEMTGSMSAGNEGRGVFGVQSTVAFSGGTSGGTVSAPVAGRLAFTRGDDAMAVEAAPGGNLDDIFVEINGSNQVLPRSEFAAFSLLSLFL